MIKKFFLGVLVSTILLQTTVAPTLTVANATETESQQNNIEMKMSSENTGLNNNELIIQNTVKGQVYTLILPEQLQLDTKKATENIAYDKTKNEVTIKGTEEKISLFLLASNEGIYPLELKEDSVSSVSLNLIIKKTESEAPKDKNKVGNNLLAADPIVGTSISDKLSLQAEASKSTLSNYTEQMTISYSINFLDGSATLKDGKLVIDFTGSGLEPVNYPKNISANPNVKSATYSSSTDKLTINLVDNIPSGAPFDIPVVVRASYDASPGKTKDLKATLSASNNNAETYEPVEKAVSVTFTGSDTDKEYESITTGDGSWDFAPRNIVSFSLMPKGYDINWPVITKKSSGNKSFKNLKLEYLKENGAGIVNFSMLQLNITKPGEFWSSLSAINGTPTQISNTPEKQVVAFGPINANMYNQLQLTVSSNMPADAVAGTVYTGTINVYDEDVLVTTLKVNSTALAAKSTVTVDSEVSKTTMSVLNGDSCLK